MYEVDAQRGNGNPVILDPIYGEQITYCFFVHGVCVGAVSMYAETSCMHTSYELLCNPFLPLIQQLCNPFQLQLLRFCRLAAEFQWGSRFLQMFSTGITLEIPCSADRICPPE